MPKQKPQPQQPIDNPFENATDAQLEYLHDHVGEQKVTRISKRALAGLQHYPVGARKTGTEIARMVIGEQKWRIERLLQDEGVYGLITGRPFVGKSHFVLQAIHALITGTPLLGLKVEKKCRVLFISYESSHKKVHRRVKKQGWLEELERNPLLDVFQAWPVFQQGGVDALRFAIEVALHGKEPRFDVIFVDPLSSFIVKAQDPDVVQTCTEQLRLMAEEYQVAILLNGWNRKLASALAKGLGCSVEEVLGPSALTGVADLVWTFDRRERVEEGMLGVVGRDMEPQAIEVRFPTAIESPPLWQPGFVVRFREGGRILRLYQEKNTPLRKTDVCDELGGDRSDVGKRVDKLIELGLLIEVARPLGNQKQGVFLGLTAEGKEEAGKQKVGGS